MQMHVSRLLDYYLCNTQNEIHSTGVASRPMKQMQQLLSNFQRRLFQT